MNDSPAGQEPTAPPHQGTAAAPGGVGGTRGRGAAQEGAEGRSGPLAMMHREMLGEWFDVGKPPLCDRCGGFYDSRGGWMVLPTCAESPLTHDEICVLKVYRGDVCPSCEIALNTPGATR